MSGQARFRGTGNASLIALTEGLLIAAAAFETLLLAALVLIGGGVSRGRGPAEALLRLNDLLVRPLAVIPPLDSSTMAGAISRQVTAVIGYGAVFLLCAGTVAWLDRRRRLY